MDSHITSVIHLAFSSEKQVRDELALAYNLLAEKGMDDLTYTHISARHPEKEETFLINPFGYLFEEVKAETLVELDFKGLSKDNSPFNKTGYRIHGDIYKRNPHINYAVHLHTIAGVAVSALKEGLLPLSQFALHFYERLGFYDYNGLALEEEESKRISEILKQGSYVGLFLRNHGTLTVGSTLQEAFFYAYYLEQACKTQIAILSQGREVLIPSPDVCRKARDQMREFEKDLGKRDWVALVRKRDKERKI